MRGTRYEHLVLLVYQEVTRIRWTPPCFGRMWKTTTGMPGNPLGLNHVWCYCKLPANRYCPAARTIVEINPPDSHHLSAAIGWLELGNPTEALAEWKRITETLHDHPDILEVGWTIHSHLKDWEQCVSKARRLTEVAPLRSWGWIHLSFALHELKRTLEAYTNLIPVLDRFPTDWLMRYNLACYSAQLGRLEEAERWLAGAMLMGNREDIRKMAAEDPDLAPLFRKG